MTKLLNAYLFRLRKNHLFWGTLAVGAGFAGLRIYAMWRDQVDYGFAASLDEATFSYAQLVGLTIAVFVSLFLGTEHSDGAIRNKVASGCSRLSIYLSGFFTVFAASLLSLAAYWAVVLAVGIPLFGLWTMGTAALLFTLLGVLLMTAAFCAIFTFITMNCSSKATNAVACILLFFLLLVASTYVYARLEAPEFVSGYEYVGGEIVAADPQPNPQYLQPGIRKVFEFLWDLLPTGQGVQYSIGAVTNPVRLLLCSLGVSALFTGAGAALFRRKDLK